MALEDIKQMTRSLSEEKKVASGPDPSDMSGWYEMFYDLQDKGEVPRDWKFEDFMDNLDALDISPTDFTKRKIKKETQVAMSDPDPMSDRFEMMDLMSEKYFGKPYDQLMPKEIIELEENWDELISQKKQPEGIMQMASAEENIVDAAIVWAASLPEFGSIEAVISSLRDGSTDYNGLINMYLDFRFGKMN